MDNFDVFINFGDAGEGFARHLYYNLVAEGISVFRNFDGKRLDEAELLQAINNSRTYIVVISKTYASSKRCLWELAKIVRNKQEEENKEILPVFYNIKVDDVKLKTDLFKKQLKILKKKVRAETVDEWAVALKEIPRYRGWTFPIYGAYNEHAKIFRGIVRRVSITHQKPIQQVLPRNLIGMDDPIEKVIEMLDIGSPGLQVIGIHGRGGIGKSTLARAVYNKLYNQFDCCCFLHGVRGSLGQGNRGCLELQKMLLKEVSYDEDLDEIRDFDDAIGKIQLTLQGKNVLMVFDDVSESDQIVRLIGSNNTMLGRAFRIIITTRDKRVLQNGEFAEFTKIHEMETMENEHALELFSWHAFRKPIPPEEYSSLSIEVVGLCGRLPLILGVIGSKLHSGRRSEWKECIKKLQEKPVYDVYHNLKISYDVLSDETKEIFLDIACFFVSKERTYEVYMWEACELFPQFGIDELAYMSFIKINEDMYWMHDIIQDFGRAIANVNRLWMKTDAIDVLMKRMDRNMKNSTIEAISLLDVGRSDVGAEIRPLRSENFAGLEKLRFLQLNNKYPWLNNNKPIKFELEGAFEDVFPSLRWLSWHNVPEQFNVTGLNLKKLIILDLSYSDITEAWPGWKEFKNVPSLEVLDLTSCKGLKKTPELSEYMYLERLVLNECSNLEEIDRTIVNLKSLQYLHLTGCYSLKRLPEEVFTLSKLKEITGRFDHRHHELMSVIPESVAQLTSLVTLRLHGLQMIALPAAIGVLFNLQLLDLKLNAKLQSLPESIGGLVKLEHLLLDTCTGLVHLPDSLTSMAKLQRLVLHNCENLVNLPDSVGEMTLLKEIDISGTAVKKLPRFIAMQKELEKLNAEGSKLQGVPTEIEDLACLKVVNFRGCSAICGLPCLSKLTRLEELNMESCKSLEQPLEFPSSLVKLYIPVASLQSIPNLSSLTNLTNLKLILKARKIDHQSTEIELMDELQCFRTSSIDRLFKLKELYLSIQGFTTTISEEFVNLPQLEKLTLLCSELEACTIPFPSGLRTINLSIRKGIVSLSLPRLNNLTHFKLSNSRDLAQISGLGEQESLRSLKITYCDSLKKLDVSMLRHLTFLEIIKCKRLRVILSVQDLKSLEKLLILGCESLQSLVGFSGSESETVQDAKSIEGSGSLPESFNSLEGGGCMMSVSKLEKLKSVWIEDCPMIRGLQDLKGIECLRSLRIRNCASLEGIFDLSESTYLTQVEISSCRKLMDIPGLEALVSLEKLTVAGCNFLERLSGLSKLQKLERIHIVECKTLVEIPGLGELESLRFLEIRHCNSLQRLNMDGLKRLEDLCIGHCQNLKDIGSCGYDYLESSLKQLKVYGCPLLEDKFSDKLKMIMVHYDDGDDDNDDDDDEEEEEESNEVVQITGTSHGDRRRDESLATYNVSTASPQPYHIPCVDVSLSGELMNHCLAPDARGVVDILSQTAPLPQSSPSIFRVDRHPLPTNNRLAGRKRHASVESLGSKFLRLSMTPQATYTCHNEDELARHEEYPNRCNLLYLTSAEEPDSSTTSVPSSNSTEAHHMNNNGSSMVMIKSTFLSSSIPPSSMEPVQKTSSTSDVHELTKDEDCTSNSHLTHLITADQEPQRRSSSYEEPHGTTTLLRGSCFNFTETQTKNLNDLSTMMMKSTFLSSSIPPSCMEPVQKTSSTHDVDELAQGKDYTNSSLLQEQEKKLYEKEPQGTTIRGPSFNFAELPQTKNLNDFPRDLSSSSSTLYGFGNDPSSPSAEESAIYKQFHSLVFNDVSSPSGSSLSLEAEDTSEAKVVLENFLSGGIRMLENASADSLGPVLAAAKVLSLKNPNDSAFWDGFYSKLPRAAMSYNLSIKKIRAAEAVHARYAELKESGKKTAAHFKALKDSEAYVSASKQMTLSQIISLRAQLAELEKKVAEADLQLQDVTSQQQLVLGRMKAQITVLKATNQDLDAKDAERDIFQPRLLSLQADWNAWKAHLH